MKNWNGQFYRLLSLLRTEESCDIAHELSVLIEEFQSTALQKVREVVLDLQLEPEARKFVPVTGDCQLGIAGGLKYIFLEEEIFMKFSSNVHGLYQSEEQANKVASHELVAMNQLFRIFVDKLHFPLMVVVDYLGFRVVVQSYIDLRKAELVYGSSDGGKVFVNRDSNAEAMATKLAHALNLRPYKIKTSGTSSSDSGTSFETVYTALDVEIYRTMDGQYFIFDVARLLPPDFPDPAIKGSRLTRLFRPKFLLKYPRQLCAEAFSPLPHILDKQELNRESYFASEYLRKTIIPGIVRSIENDDFFRDYASANFHMWNPSNNVLYDEIAKSAWISVQNLVQFLHSFGMNMRYIGIMRINFRTTSLRILMLEEILSRTCKQVLRHQLRKVLIMDGISSCHSVILKYFQLLFGSSEASQHYWCRAIKSAAIYRFGRMFTDEEFDTQYDLREIVRLRVIWNKISFSLNLKFRSNIDNIWKKSGYSKEDAGILTRTLRMSDLISYEPTVNGLQQVSVEEAQVYRRKATMLLLQVTSINHIHINARKADLLMSKAVDLFRDSMHQESSGDASGLESWGLTLVYQSRLYQTSEALSALDEASERFRNALVFSPSSVHIFCLLGWVHIEKSRREYQVWLNRSSVVLSHSARSNAARLRIKLWVELANQAFSSVTPDSSHFALSLAGQAVGHILLFLASKGTREFDALKQSIVHARAAVSVDKNNVGMWRLLGFAYSQYAFAAGNLEDADIAIRNAEQSFRTASTIISLDQDAQRGCRTTENGLVANEFSRVEAPSEHTPSHTHSAQCKHTFNSISEPVLRPTHAKKSSPPMPNRSWDATSTEGTPAEMSGAAKTRRPSANGIPLERSHPASLLDKESEMQLVKDMEKYSEDTGYSPSSSQESYSQEFVSSKARKAVKMQLILIDIAHAQLHYARRLMLEHSKVDMLRLSLAHFIQALVGLLGGMRIRGRRFDVSLSEYHGASILLARLHIVKRTERSRAACISSIVCLFSFAYLAINRSGSSLAPRLLACSAAEDILSLHLEPFVELTVIILLLCCPGGARLTDVRQIFGGLEASCCSNTKHKREEIDLSSLQLTTTELTNLGIADIELLLLSLPRLASQCKQQELDMLYRVAGDMLSVVNVLEMMESLGTHHLFREAFRLAHATLSQNYDYQSQTEVILRGSPYGRKRHLDQNWMHFSYAASHSGSISSLDLFHGYLKIFSMRPPTSRPLGMSASEFLTLSASGEGLPSVSIGRWFYLAGHFNDDAARKMMQFHGQLSEFIPSKYLLEHANFTVAESLIIYIYDVPDSLIPLPEFLMSVPANLHERFLSRLQDQLLELFRILHDHNVFVGTLHPEMLFVDKFTLQITLPDALFLLPPRRLQLPIYIMPPECKMDEIGGKAVDIWYLGLFMFSLAVLDSFSSGAFQSYPGTMLLPYITSDIRPFLRSTLTDLFSDRFVLNVASMLHYRPSVRILAYDILQENKDADSELVVDKILSGACRSKSFAVPEVGPTLGTFYDLIRKNGWQYHISTMTHESYAKSVANELSYLSMSGEFLEVDEGNPSSKSSIY